MEYVRIKGCYDDYGTEYKDYLRFGTECRKKPWKSRFSPL